MNISPSLVALRLEKLCIIDRKHLAKGYFDYLDSNLYKENIQRRNEIREKNKSSIAYNFDITEIKDKVKGNLLNIKSLIREKYLKY